MSEGYDALRLTPSATRLGDQRGLRGQALGSVHPSLAITLVMIDRRRAESAPSRDNAPLAYRPRALTSRSSVPFWKFAYGHRARSTSSCVMSWTS